MVVQIARRAAVASAIVIVAAASTGVGARAQPAPIDPIEHGELMRMQLPLQPIQPTSDRLKQWEAAPRQSFGPFDESRVGFRSMTVTLERIPFDCDHSDYEISDTVVAHAIRVASSSQPSASRPRTPSGKPERDSRSSTSPPPAPVSDFEPSTFARMARSMCAHACGRCLRSSLRFFFV